eukprot:12230926-Alexandrium_andersonii.AAC.1
METSLGDPLSPLFWDTIGGCCGTPPVGHQQPRISRAGGKAQGQNEGVRAPGAPVRRLVPRGHPLARRPECRCAAEAHEHAADRRAQP